MARNLPEILNKPLRQFPRLWSSFFPSSMEDLFDEDLLAQDFSNKAARIYEENNQLHVEVPLPGLNLNEIDVSLDKGILLVKGESTEEEKDKKRKYYRSSKRSYSFSLVLPTQIDDTKEPQAVYENGILNISLQLAKKEDTKKIIVKAGNGKK